MKLAKEKGLKSFWIGRKEECGVPNICVDSVLEDACNQLYDEVGEVSETYLEGITDEQRNDLGESLNNVFYGWHKKNSLFPSCYRVEDSEVIEVK